MKNKVLILNIYPCFLSDPVISAEVAGSAFIMSFLVKLQKIRTVYRVTQE